MFTADKIIVYVMLGFMAFSAIDKFFLNNRFGYGPKFEEAFNAAGPLALAIVGIMCFAPVLGSLLTPVFAPLYNLIGADPAMIAGSLFASDMGGYVLAEAMTANPEIVVLSGIFLGSMMGIAIIFVIPYTSTVVAKEDKPALHRGIMIGITVIPLGCLISGLIGGIGIMTLLINLAPVLMLSIILALLLGFFPNATAKVFSWFSKFLTAFLAVVLIFAIIEALAGISFIGMLNDATGLKIVEMNPIGDQFIVVGYIVIMLAGAYPFIHFLTTILSKPLLRFGKLIRVNPVAVAGMLASLASAIPMYPLIKDMDKRGKVMATAFSVCAGFCLGDILAYTNAQAPDYVLAMIIGKLAAGVLAAIIAGLTVRTKKEPAADVLGKQAGVQT